VDALYKSTFSLLYFIEYYMCVVVVPLHVIQMVLSFITTAARTKQFVLLNNVLCL